MRRCLDCGTTLEGSPQQRRRCVVCSAVRRGRLEEARAEARLAGQVWDRPYSGRTDDLSAAEIDARFREALSRVKRERRFTVEPWAGRGIGYEPH